MWLLFAFSGPILWALSTHIDKYLVERFFKNSDTAVLMVFTALIGVLMLPFIWFFAPHDVVLPLRAIIVMAASGALYMGAMLFYLRAIQSEEASVIAPLFQTSIIFTLILAYLLLGETLTLLQGVGGALVVLGALSLSLDSSFHFKKLSAKIIFLMLMCTFVLALSSVIFKYFAVQGTFWGTAFWTYVGEALFGVGILAIPGYLKQFIGLFQREPGAMVAINSANELINLGGGLGVRFASLLAPIALVSAISSTSTLFVFLFGILISVFLPSFGREDISRSNLIRKGVAAALVVAGIIFVNLPGAY